MKVRELIEKLSACNPEADIRLAFGNMHAWELDIRPAVHDFSGCEEDVYEALDWEEASEGQIICLDGDSFRKGIIVE